LLSCIVHAQPRVVVRMNEGWQFLKGDSTGNNSWQNIHLPHTWNVDDVMDDVPGYYRGVCWYRKIFTPGNELKGKEVSFYFEGANQEAEIFINGKKAGQHTGGYTGFSVPVTQYLQFNAPNEILVKVDNSFNKNIAPLTADFTFYGGIYRDVYLTATDKIHFTADAGSNGVYITTPQVSKQQASVEIKSLLTNSTDKKIVVTVVSSLTDKAGRRVAQTRSTATIDAHAGSRMLQTIEAVKSPELWSPEKPYLYTVETKIINSKGVVLDAITNPLGFRWFSFDADKGFLLNGEPYKLVGASRHQDYKGLGNALPNEFAINDVALLKNMGANFLRVAHYPQDPAVLQACDSIGLLASVEIPVVNEITETDSFYNNCAQMQVEMIRQNFNHPSVIVWCYMNEVLLRPHFNEDKERQKEYFSAINKLAHRLEDLTRKQDPTRYTMMANHGNLNQYKNAGLLEIPMIVGWNLYSGWYGGSMDDFPAFLDEFHKNYPAKPFMVTEYGADADPRIRSAQPVRFDKSIEYSTLFHQFYFIEMMKRPYVAGAIIWNLADFNSETRTETMPHINNKGLLEWDRTPKDPYYFYQAMLLKQPFIKILGSCKRKYGLADSTSPVCYQPVQIASNLDSITIQLNGITKTTLKVKDGLCEWELPFREGRNTLVVEGRRGGKIYKDSISTKIHLQPYCLTDAKIPFEQINIMLGAERYYVDENGDWWQPDKAYIKGGWGYVGGREFKIEKNSRLPYGTDKNIIGTNDDPLYQTQQTGIRQYRLDVPPGTYEVVLHF
ncbi:MAG TPA: glycoside hydrolase family 2 TIM barrel-domain containing protein, partial [Ferruginibacter sp.]|nr:glycoside hydrolase family 2 TIM barrel-domain containing protein [Ferruginibacter sp.]